MDLDHPGVLFSGMLIGLIGLVLFIYGRKAPDLRALFAGVALSVAPFFAHTLLSLWGVTGVCALALYASRRLV